MFLYFSYCSTSACARGSWGLQLRLPRGHHDTTRESPRWMRLLTLHYLPTIPYLSIISRLGSSSLHFHISHHLGFSIWVGEYYLCGVAFASLTFTEGLLLSSTQYNLTFSCGSFYSFCCLSRSVFLSLPFMLYFDWSFACCSYS